MGPVPLTDLPPDSHLVESDNLGAAPKAHRGARILVVDDDPSVRSVLRSTLETAGFYMQSAANGAAALEVFRRSGADLIVLDVSMPDMDGFDVCQRIRQADDVPVVFLTGTTNPIVRGHSSQLVSAVGGDKLLNKPLDAQALLTAIDELLSRRTTE